MDDFSSATGISSASSVATISGVIWYIKSRLIKYEKNNAKLLEELKEATTDNRVQAEQIKGLKDEIKELRTLLLRKNG